MNVFSIHCAWNLRGEEGHDVVKIFADKEKAKQFLQDFVENEKETTWIADYWDNVSNSPDCEDWDTNYEEREDYFFYEIDNGEFYTEIWIEEKPLIE